MIKAMEATANILHCGDACSSGGVAETAALLERMQGLSIESSQKTLCKSTSKQPADSAFASAVDLFNPTSRNPFFKAFYDPLVNNMKETSETVIKMLADKNSELGPVVSRTVRTMAEDVVTRWFA
jgi:hypothetical protein